MRTIHIIKLVVLLLPLSVSFTVSAEDIAHYCVNDQRPFLIHVWPQSTVTPGETVYWTVWVDQGSGVVGVSHSDTGPYSDSIIVPTLILSNGEAWSDYFYIKGLMVGCGSR
jgi:hypothetical protein